MQYQIVRQENDDDLSESVNALIEEGWEPIGGVCVSVTHVEWENERKGITEDHDDVIWCQAMIKR